MRWIARVAAALLVIVAAVPATASARAFEPCDEDSAVLCGSVKVPLDRRGQVPGELDIYVERARARDLPAKAAGSVPRGAIFALAGGPGQPATQFTTDFIFAFGERRLGRDVVTFDQRGTGRSGLLRCPEVERVSLLSRYPEAGQRCAERLGARRGLYTTSESVDDMEAVRQAIGVDKIAIYGASYGTKVALLYASRYPEHVERLILDSVVTAEGPDPLYRDTFAAMPRVMRSACGSKCDWTEDAGADLATLADQLAVGPARGAVVDRRGRAQPEAIGLSRLFFLMLGGDFAPRLRAALPGAIYNAQRGDPAELLRLAKLSEAGAEPASPREFSSAIFTATICEEVPFPWQRGAAFEDRERQANDTIAALGEGAFGPFGPGAVLQTDLIQLCRRWNEATPGPPSVSPPLPDVPALLLEGEFDLRTPLESAQRVAPQLPQATLLTIPATGHSTLGSDASSCTLTAISRFLRSRSVAATCAEPSRAVPPDRPAPANLGEVEPVPRVPAEVGRVLQAVELTLADVEDQVGTQALLSFDSGGGAVGGGGLRAGRFRAGNSGLSITRVVFVPGVRVSGRLLNRASRIGRITVSGSRAVRGRIVYGGRGIVSGRIGGRNFRVRLSQVDTTPPEIELGAAKLRPEYPRPKFGP